MRRRLLTLAMVIAAGALLAGCGGGSAGTDTGAAAAGAGGDTGANQPVGGTTTGAAASGDASAPDEVAGALGDAAGATTSGNDLSGDIPESDGDELDNVLQSNGSKLFAHAEVDEGDGNPTIGIGEDVGSSDPTTQTETTTTTTATASAPDTAKIQVETVGVGAASVFNLSVNSLFPKDTQQFVVKSISSSTAVVELTAGEFTNGSTGWTLVKGKPVTLVNQNEGTTYKLLLLSTS